MECADDITDDFRDDESNSNQRQYAQLPCVLTTLH